MIENLFTETRIATRFGNCNIRVYADVQGKETVVLSTENIDNTKPVLVRIHSECLTGDTMGSLQCDCGEQLEESRKQISESGNGVFIYLRQEGRGIGLFEKIKSYQLQGKGFDTYEANVMLGHNPDERTYEKAKTALIDLGVTRIRLLTNNPSKVSEIAKHGIEVVERVPLIIQSNKHNDRYFESKRNKFKHFFNEEISYYFYQFHADTSSHVHQIGEFLKDKKHDPLLRICVGVSAEHSILNNPEKITDIENIFNACNAYAGFIPVLHFSFRNSSEPLMDIKAIEEKLPFVKHIQLNDVPCQELETLQLACNSFYAYIPLSDANFHLIENAGFRETIEKRKAFILLDNSKGKGISESQEVLKKKINVLLEYGLNDIALCGGFGPNDLNSFLELRRYHKINFSIDAETKLKTDGQIDMEKTKLYLTQLYSFFIDFIKNQLILKSKMF